MKLYGYLSRAFAIVALGLYANCVAAQDYDQTYDGVWRGYDDVVPGWDWSLPPDTRPAEYSGIFNLNTSVPPDFPGNRLKQVNAKWRELEPTEGNYDFSSIREHLDDPRYQGIMLNVRGMVVAIEDENGNPTREGEISAPRWLSDSAPKTQEGLKNGVRVTNMHIYDRRVKSKYIQLIEAIGRSGIPENPRLKAQIIHGVSSSRGEEWTGRQASLPEAIDAMEELIVAWTRSYGPNAKKLAWLKENPERLFVASVVNGGTGIRGGAIEKWLRNQYTPGRTAETGQSLDENGHLIVNEAFAPIAERRHFQDQNEAYREGVSAPRANWGYNYRLANLRMLQMRRNVAWLDSNAVINPRMFNWMSLELGHNVATAPDAWVLLMRTWARTGGEDREINNFERWMYQRDTSGARTTPILSVDHGFNANANDNLPENLWKSDIARIGSPIGIAVNDKFLAGGPHPVAIKVTFFDSNAEEWALVYESPNGTIRKTVRGTNSDTVQTATFFVNDFSAPANDMDFDFVLESATGRTPFMMVRLIRLGAPVIAPEAPGNFRVDDP